MINGIPGDALYQTLSCGSCEPVCSVNIDALHKQLIRTTVGLRILAEGVGVCIAVWPGPGDLNAAAYCCAWEFVLCC